MTLIILLNALFASSFTMGKVLVAYAQPIFLTGIRMLLGGVLLLSYQFLYNKKHCKFDTNNIPLFIQAMLTGIYFNYILRFWALNYLTSSKTNFFYNLAPFFSSFYSYMLFDERMSKKQWMGLAVGLVGIAPMLIQGTDTESIAGGIWEISLPEIAVIISVLCHSYSWIVVRKLVRTHEYHPMMINGITMTSGGIFALLTSYMVEQQGTIADPFTFCGWLLLVVLVSNIVCYSLYGHLLKTYTATFLSFAGFLSPLFSAFYGWAFLHEQITWHFYASASIVFVGLYVFYQDEITSLQQRHALNS